MYNNLFAKQFEEEEDKEDKKMEAATAAKSEYDFEGFTIILNEKILLTPVSLKK